MQIPRDTGQMHVAGLQAMQASWVPPEAAAAAAAAAEQNGSWSCASCTLINAPHTTRCEACHKNRPARPPQPAQPSSGRSVNPSAPRSGLLSPGMGAALPLGGGSTTQGAGDAGANPSHGQEAPLAAPEPASSSQEDDKGKGKARRVPKFERLRVTGGIMNPPFITRFWELKRGTRSKAFEM